MFRVIACVCVLWFPLAAQAQLSYQTGSGLSFSTAYAGEAVPAGPGSFDQDDDFGELATTVAAAHQGDTASANASVEQGFFKGVQSKVAADNSHEFDLQFANHAWSLSQQSADWDVGSWDDVTFVFTANCSVSDATMSNGPPWSEEGFLSGEATAEEFRFEWELTASGLEWELWESGYLIDFGTQAMLLSAGNWKAAVTVSVDDDDIGESVGVFSKSRASQYLNDVRQGNAQTGVIIL